MHHELVHFLARDRARALREEAAAAALGRQAGRRRHPEEEPISIRLSRPGDAAALARLAQLEESACPPSALVVALRGGRIVAAVSIEERAATLADPFEPTAELLELLRLRAAQIRHAGRSWRVRHRRGGPAPA